MNNAFKVKKSLLINASGSIALDIQGNSGQLLSVEDSLTGSLMSVNDISGLPILEVFDDDRVVMGTFGANTLVVSGSNVGIGTESPATKLDVNGDLTIPDKIIHSGDTNTAIRFPAADTVTVETAGVERVRVTSSGDVGIGTDSPRSSLDINATDAITIPTGTSAQRPITPAAGMIRYNAEVGFIEWYDDVADNWFPISSFPGVAATGGTVTDIELNGQLFRVHTFTSDGTFDVTRGGDVEYLVVGGGGGGGNNVGGGGGAGGYRCSVAGEQSGGGASAEPPLILTGNTNFTVTVGAGGLGKIGSTGSGFDGEGSSFASVSCVGGGGGGMQSDGRDGGSGGGAGTLDKVGGSPTSDEGTKGGDSSTGGNPQRGGGGGGASSAGTNASNNVQGTGGAGLSSTITGTSIGRAGGGGGGSFNTSPGAGGGFGASAGTQNVNATDAAVNSGAGGGGGGFDGPIHSGGNGGSGIVIIRYRIG